MAILQVDLTQGSVNCNWLWNQSSINYIGLIDSGYTNCKYFDGYNPSNSLAYGTYSYGIYIQFGISYVSGYGTNFTSSTNGLNNWNIRNTYRLYLTIDSTQYGPYPYEWEYGTTGAASITNGYFHTNSDVLNNTYVLQFSYTDSNSIDHQTLYNTFDSSTDSIYLETNDSNCW